MSTLPQLNYYDAGRQAKRTSMPPLTFTWPLIIALSACGGGGGGSSSKPTVSIRADIKEEVIDTVGDVRDGIVKVSSEKIKKPLGGDDQGKDDGEDDEASTDSNDSPIRTFDNPNFINEIGTENQNALIVGHEFSYQFNPTTFQDPEGGPITLSLRPGSNLPPGLQFDPSTGMISGTVLPIDNLSVNGKLFEIVVVGTDNQGLKKQMVFFFRYYQIQLQKLKGMKTALERK